MLLNWLLLYDDYLLFFHFWNIRLMQDKSLFLFYSTMTYFRREIIERCFLSERLNIFILWKFSLLRFRNPEQIYTCEGRGMFSSNFSQFCKLVLWGYVLIFFSLSKDFNRRLEHIFVIFPSTNWFCIDWGTNLNIACCWNRAWI